MFRMFAEYSVFRLFFTMNISEHTPKPMKYHDIQFSTLKFICGIHSGYIICRSISSP